jgi:hypothetical protein
LGTRFAAVGEHLSEQILVHLTLLLQNPEHRAAHLGVVGPAHTGGGSTPVIDLAADHEVLRSQRVPNRPTSRATA